MEDWLLGHEPLPRRLNVRQNLEEPGVALFDVVRQADDLRRLVLVVDYRRTDATAAHKGTRHCQVWRNAVASMMAKPRSSVRFAEVFPEPEDW